MQNIIQRLPKSIINRAKSLNSTLISDAMGNTGSMNYKIKPVASGMKMVGTALTVDLKAGDNLFLHHAIYSGGKGDVIVVDGKNHKEHAYLGELMASAAKAMGIEGIVVDGLVRDKENLKEVGLPIFAKGFIPNGPYKDGPGAINVPISCAGVSVIPGDLIIGDDDGVVVVPKGKIEEVLSKAEAKLRYEKKRQETISKYIQLKKEGNPSNFNIAPDWLDEKMKKYGY